MNNRRKLVVALGAGALVAPLGSFAQQPKKVWRIGYLDPRTPLASSEYYDGFVRGMRDLGYLQGKHFVVERRFAEGNLTRLRELAAEIVASSVDVIITDSTPAVQALLTTTTTIPIVVAVLGDPIVAGIAKSLSRPGGNVTGLSNLSQELDEKRMAMIAEVSATRSGIAVIGRFKVTPARLQATAERLKRPLIFTHAESVEEIHNSFALMAQKRAGSLVIEQDGFLSSHAPLIAKMSLEKRIPCIGGRRQIAEAGCLLSYGVDYVDMFRRAATFIDKILKGVRPGDIPFEQAASFEMVVNMRSAKALHIKIPPSIMVQATKVIE